MAGMKDGCYDLQCSQRSPHARSLLRISNHVLHLQFMLIVTASSIGEELFYRAAIQVCAAPFS